MVQVFRSRPVCIVEVAGGDKSMEGEKERKLECFVPAVVGWPDEEMSAHSKRQVQTVALRGRGCPGAAAQRGLRGKWVQITKTYPAPA